MEVEDLGGDFVEGAGWWEGCRRIRRGHGLQRLGEELRCRETRQSSLDCGTPDCRLTLSRIPSSRSLHSSSSSASARSRLPAAKNVLDAAELSDVRLESGSAGDEDADEHEPNALVALSESPKELASEPNELDVAEARPRTDSSNDEVEGVGVMTMG